MRLVAAVILIGVLGVEKMFRRAGLVVVAFVVETVELASVVVVVVVVVVDFFLLQSTFWV